MSHNNFKATMYGMFANQQNCDVKFACDDPTSETGKSTIMAHKLILAMASDVFCTMFYGEAAKNESVTDEKERLSPIHIEDVQMSTFMLFLGFMYNKMVNFETPDVAAEFYYVAHKYNSLDALKFIKDYMLDKMCPDTVIAFYEAACLHENHQLKEASVKMFSEHTGDVINSESFLTADPQTIEAIYKLNVLNITSEAQLIHALERYVSHYQQADCDIAKKVRPALSHIRFLTLSAALISQTTLLAPADALAVIGCLSSNCKMPTFLSTNDQNRSAVKVVTSIKLEMMRRLNEVYSSKYCPCCNAPTPVWECKSFFGHLGFTNHTTLKNIYEKYSHTWLYDYDAKDLATVYDIYNHLYKWSE